MRDIQLSIIVPFLDLKGELRAEQKNGENVKLANWLGYSNEVFKQFKFFELIPEVSKGNGKDQPIIDEAFVKTVNKMTNNLELLPKLSTDKTSQL